MAQRRPDSPRLLIGLFGASLTLSIGTTPAPAQNSADILAPAAQREAEPAIEIPEKAARYHAALLRRAEPGLVFDRFCDAFLTESTPEALETFLESQAAGGDPADALIHGFYLAREGRHVDALRVFRDTLAQHPGSAAAHFFKAHTEAATLDFDTALTDLANAADANPAPALAADIAQLRGRLLVRTGQREEAIQVWDALLEDSPNDPGLYETLVAIQTEEGLFDAALATLDALIARTTDPQKKIARQLWRGDLLQQAGQKESAREAYEAALNDVGTGGWLERQVLAQLEQTYRREQELDRFTVRLEALAQKHPQRIALLRRRAVILNELGRTDDAITQWQALLERAPGDRELKAVFADVLADSGKTQEAATLVETLRDDRPDDGELRLQLAGLYKKLDRPDDAAAQVRAFRDASDGSLTSGVRAVRTLERLELNSQAEAMARELAAAFADDPANAYAANENLAELLFRLDKRDEATGLWTAAAAEATDATAVLSAARALSSRGLTTPALDALIGRVDDFPADPELLAALADAALRDGRPEAAAVHLRPWLSALTDVEATGRAVTTAARVARSAEREVSLIDELNTATPRTDGETWLLSALLEQTNDPGGADALLTPEPGQEDQQSETLVRARVELLKGRGQNAAAADILETFVERPGNIRSVLVRELIDLYSRDLRTDQALAWVERWKQASPGSVSPWLQQAALLAGEGKDPAALETLQTASRRFPDDLSVSTALADAFTNAGRTNDAARIYWNLYDQADSISAKLPWVAKLATLTQFDDGGERVITQLKARRDQDRNSAGPHLALAECYRVLDRYEDRRSALLEAARVEPENFDLLLTIARTEEQGGELERSVATLRRALPLDKTNRVRERLAGLYVYLNQVDRAAALMEAPDGSPADPDAALGFADALAGIDEWEQAAAFLQGSVAAHPADYRVAYLRAVALYEVQDQSAADAFLDILGLTEELPGSTNNNDPFAAQLASLDEMIVPESLQIISQMSASYRAMSHRSGQQVVFWPGQSGPQTTVMLPYSVADAHTLAIAYLRSIAQESDEAGRDTLVAALQGRGVRLAQILVDMPMQPQGPDFLTPETIETHKDDPAVLGLAILMSGWGNQPLESDLLEHGEQMFAESRPSLALVAALARHTQAVEAGEDNPEGWDRILTLFDGISQPPEMLVAMLGRYVGGLPGMPDSAGLPAEQSEAIGLQMRRWYGELDAASQMRPWILMSIVNGLTTQEDWSGLAQFITEETVSFQSKAKNKNANNPMAAMIAMQYGQQGPIQELTFPPPSLSEIPSELMTLFDPNGQNMFGMGGTSVDHPAVLAALPADCPPLLRALVAGAADDHEALVAALEPQAEGDTPTLDTLTTLAAWQGTQGEPEAAAATLAKASYLPMSRAERTALDGAIVAYALTIDQPDDNVKSVAQKSALRLRQSASSFEERTAVVEALGHLGLQEEADRLEERLANAPAQATTNFNHGGGFRQLTGTDRIETLLADERRDDALRLALREVTNLGQNLANGNSWALQQDDAQQLISLIKNRHLTEDLIALADPGENARGQRAVNYGLILEALGENERAVEAYRNTLAQKSNPGVAVRLVLAELNLGNAEGVASAFAAVPERDQPQFGMLLQNTINQSMHNNPDMGLTLAEAVTRWINDAPAPEKLSLNWLYSLWESLTQQQWNNDRAPHLYNTSAWADIIAAPDDEPADHADNLRERLKAHDDLATAMLKVPSAAPEAAARLALSAELRGQPLDDLIDPLFAALTAEQPRGGLQQMHFYSHGFDPDLARKRPAAEVLAAWCAKQDNSERIETAAASLREQRRKNEAETLESFYALYSPPHSDFEASADSLLKQSQRDHTLAGAALPAVVDAWTAAGRPETDLEPLIFKNLNSSHFGGDTASGAMMRYAQGLAERDGPSAAADFLERFATETIGPADKRAELIEKHYDPSQWNFQSLNGKMHNFVNVMQAAVNIPETTWAAIEQLAPYAASTKGAGHVDLNGLIDESYDAIGDRDADPDAWADGFIAWLASSPLVQDTTAFRSFPQSGNNWNNHRSALDMFRGHDHGDDDEASPSEDPVLAWLDTQPRTLGVVLVNAAWRDEPLADTLQKLAPYQEAIAALDADGKNQIVAALPELSGLPEDAPEVAVALANQLDGARAATLATQAQNILDIKALNPHGNQVWQLGETVGDLANDLYAEGSTEMALDLLAHWDGLIKKLNRNRGYFGNRLADTLRQTMYHGNSVDPLLMVNAMAHDPRLASVVDADLMSATSSRLDNVMDAIDPVEGDGRTQPRRWLAGLEELADQLEAEPAAALLPALAAEARDRHRPADYQTAFARLAKRAGADPSPLFVTAEAALHIARLRDRSDDETPDPADLGFIIQHLEALAADDTLPPVTRLTLMGSVLNQLPATDTPSSVTAAAARLLADVLATDPQVITNSTADAILNRARVADRSGDGWPEEAQLIDNYLNAVSARRRNQPGEGLSIQLPAGYDMVSGNLNERSPRAALSILEMALDTGLNDSADRLLAMDSGTVAATPPAWAHLAAHGRADRAAALIRRHHADTRAYLVEGAAYTPAVAAAEAAVLAELQDDAALVYFARCAFASLADPDVRSGDAPPLRRDRLADLAQQYPSVDLDNRPQLRDRILLLLSSDDHAAALLAEPLAEASGGLTLPAVMGQNFHRGNSRQQLVLASMFAQLAQHDLEALGLQLDAIYAPNNSPNGNWESRNQHEAFRDVIRRGFIPGHGRDEDASAVTDAWTPDQLVAFADLWERAIYPPDDFDWHGNEYSDRALLLVLWAVDPSRPADTFAQAKAADEDNSRQWQTNYHYVLNALKALADQPTLTPDAKIAMVERVLVGAIAAKITEPQAHLLPGLVFDESVLTVDEVASHRDVLTANLGATAHLGVAEVLVRGHHADADAAVAVVTAAVTGPDGDNGQRLTFAHTLVEHDRPDLALPLIEGWEPRNRHQRKAVEKLRQQIAPAEPEPTPASDPESTPDAAPAPTGNAA
ncbi:MAG: tetratricopeptide repeat protein [Planctomycetota bacterium]